MKMKHFSILFVFMILSLAFNAQKLNYENSENAGKMFDLGNYKRAKEIYRELYKKDLTNVKNKYRFGVCLVYSYEREDAIKILESVSKESSCPIEVWYHLANAYHLTNRFDKAITFFNKYINSNGAKPDFVVNAKRSIEMCKNAELLIKKPLNVEFENLGPRVNSKGEEYIPIAAPDESILLYTTRREGTTGRIYDLENYYTADIYATKYKYGNWSKARSVGYPNSYGNEQTAGISENGEYVIYYVNNPQSKNNLQISVKSKSSYKRAIKIDSKKINQNSSEQISATISNDGNYLIFSSNRNDGKGGQDLYFCKKLPNEKWGNPINMGEVINTIYDECYPYLSDEGTTLYFSSKGHNSMGGFDVFKCDINLETQEWSKPVNIGYPLNSADDNIGISFSQNKKYAYVSTYRKDSQGNLDIYRVNFKDTDPSYSTVKGFVLDADSSVMKLPLTIEIIDKATDELYGVYEVNPKTGNYLMILPPNKYEISIDVPEKGVFKKELLIYDRNKFKSEINYNIRVIFDSTE